jgi:hypothetical protein
LGPTALRPKNSDSLAYSKQRLKASEELQSATMEEKKAFISAALSYLRDRRFIADWDDDTSRDRFDYRVRVPERVAELQQKLDVWSKLEVKDLK